MILWLLILSISGPFVLVAASILLLGYTGGLSDSSLYGLFIMACCLAALQALAAGCVSVIYRWCFKAAATRGVSVLAALLISIFALCCDPLLSLFLKLTSGQIVSVTAFEFLASLLVEGGRLLGMAVVLSMCIVLCLEIPLRWAQGSNRMLCDGIFEVLRCFGVIIFFIIGSALLREEGLRRLVILVERALT